MYKHTKKINADSKAPISCYDTLSTRSLHPKCVHAFKTDKKQKRNLIKNGTRCEQVLHKGECQQSSQMYKMFLTSLIMLLLSRFSRVQLCATPEMTAHQAPPFLGLSRQEHWSGLPFPSPMHESEKRK